MGIGVTRGLKWLFLQILFSEIELSTDDKAPTDSTLQFPPLMVVMEVNALTQC